MNTTSSKFLLNIAVLLSTVYASDCLSEIKNCGGKWTNGQCEEETEETLPETTTVTISAPDLKDRRSLYTDLDLRNFRAKREYGVEVSLEDARIACLSDRASLKECRKVTKSQNDRLDVLIVHARQSVPTPQPTAQTSLQDHNQVVIINNEDDDDDWKRKWWWRKRKDRHTDTYDLSDKHEVDEGALANQAKKRREAEEDPQPIFQRGGKLKGP